MQETEARPHPGEGTAGSPNAPAGHTTVQAESAAASPQRPTDSSGNVEEPADAGSPRLSRIVSALLQDVPVVVAQEVDSLAMTLVDRGLQALFSDTVRQQVQQEADEWVYEMLSDALEPLRDDPTGIETARETEQLARRMTAEAIDSIFAGRLRDEIRQHAVEAVRDLFHRDYQGATEHGGETLGALLHGVMRVLQRHSEQLFPLVLKLSIEGMQTAAQAKVEDGASALESKPQAEIQDKATSMRHEFRERSEELRDRLEDTVQTIRERIQGPSTQSGGSSRARWQPRPSPGASSNSSRRPPPGTHPSAGTSPRRPPAGPSATRR